MCFLFFMQHKGLSRVHTSSN
uniref:Uncharacterized protein n=1 Tax=Rhizophora mucronata TaxID=61149 RepID=A0A2P2QT35_RHIMU